MNSTKQKRAAILLSRQAMHPCAKEAWIGRTLQALDWIKEQDYSLLSSTGMATWDFITVMAAEKGICTKLMVPIEADDEIEWVRDLILSQYELNQSMVEFEFVPGSRKLAMASRDLRIAEAADILIPISIRPHGRMDDIIRSSSKEIYSRLQIPYSMRKIRLGYGIETDAISEELRAFELSDQPLLIHWTRAANEKWPNETTATFIKAIAGNDMYPRSALATLKRIVTGGWLLASVRHMPDKTATVSFSELKPSEALPLMRWRARYRQMSFEPYGLGIDLQTARDVGVRPVLYRSSIKDASNSQPRWLQQSEGRITDWSNEKEYRFHGDLGLGRLDRSKLVLFCRYKSEADQLSELTGLNTIHIKA